jgi:hypothetical protein
MKQSNIISIMMIAGALLFSFNAMAVALADNNNNDDDEESNDDGNNTVIAAINDSAADNNNITAQLQHAFNQGKASQAFEDLNDMIKTGVEMFGK